jgi:hypothetical protein
MIELPPPPNLFNDQWAQDAVRAYGEACARAALEAAETKRLNGYSCARCGCVDVVRDDPPSRRATAPSSPSSSQTRS